MEKTVLVARIASVASPLAMLVGAVGYHLWRVATLRADFDRLGDTRLGLVVFGLVALGASVLRWSLPGERAISMAIAIAVVNLLVYTALFERSNRSSSLVYAAWMASAVVDLAVTGLWTLDAVDTGSRTKMVATGAELVLVAGAAWRFFRSSPAVQARGYRRLFRQ